MKRIRWNNVIYRVIAELKCFPPVHMLERESDSEIIFAEPKHENPSPHQPVGAKDVASEPGRVLPHLSRRRSANEDATDTGHVRG